MQQNLPQRERGPLQKSMFLESTTNRVTTINNRPSVPIQYTFPINNVRRNDSGYNNEAGHYQNQGMIIQQNRQIITTNSYEENNQGHRFPEKNPLFDIYKKLDELSKVVDKHQEQLRELHPEAELSKRVLAEMKKNLPVFTGGNDVYDHILTQKVELKQIQEELTKIPKIQDIEQIIKKQMQSQGKLGQANTNSNLTLTGSSQNKSNEIDHIIKDMGKKFDFFQNIISNFETEVSIMKKNLSNLSMEMKVSPIVSNSCIMLKYQQLFKARNKSQNDIVLSESTYYIDNEGHLLDCHSRYIVDQKGKKIKLQQKHLAMLKNQKILQ